MYGYSKVVIDERFKKSRRNRSPERWAKLAYWLGDRGLRRQGLVPEGHDYQRRPDIGSGEDWYFSYGVRAE